MLEAQDSISESSDASYLEVTDTAGIYKGSDPYANLTGWGAPNVLFTDVTSVLFQVKLPDPITLLPQKDFFIFKDTGFNYIDIFSAGVFPNVINVPVKILASVFGTSKLPMGIYEFLVSYSGSWGATIYPWKMRQAFIAQACCCVKALQAELECGCQDTIKRDDWMNGVVALAAVESDMNCLKQNKTAEAIKRLNDICRRNPCGCF